MCVCVCVCLAPADFVCLFVYLLSFYIASNIDCFDLVVDVLQEDTLAWYLFIICLDYVLRTSIDIMKDIGFKRAKEWSRRYLAQTIANPDYADDIALLTNTPAQAKTLLHSLERAAAGIVFDVNTDKTEYMPFNQRGDISTLNGSSLKLVDNFTNLGSSVSSTEKDVNPQLAKAWTAIDRVSVRWMSDLTDKIKYSFSKWQLCQFCYMDALHGH